MTTSDSKTSGECITCGVRVHLVPGTPGSVFATAYWSHDDRFVTELALDASETEFQRRMHQFGGQPKIAQVYAREVYDRVLNATVTALREPHEPLPA